MRPTIVKKSLMELENFPLQQDLQHCVILPVWHGGFIGQPLNIRIRTQWNPFEYPSYGDYKYRQKNRGLSFFCASCLKWNKPKMMNHHMHECMRYGEFWWCVHCLAYKVSDNTNMSGDLRKRMKYAYHMAINGTVSGGIDVRRVEAALGATLGPLENTQSITLYEDPEYEGWEYYMNRRLGNAKPTDDESNAIDLDCIWMPWEELNEEEETIHTPTGYVSIFDRWKMANE